MTQLSIFAGTILFGYAFWYLGEAVGMGIFGCFLLSGVGSVIGVFAGWWLPRRFR